jgi:uncharacterized protein YrzB (UPF0473 family)
MANGNHEMYAIILQNIETNEVDKSYIFLNKNEAKKMSKRIDEIVYKNFSGNKLNEWKLVEFKIKTQ